MFGRLFKKKESNDLKAARWVLKVFKPAFCEESFTPEILQTTTMLEWKNMSPRSAWLDRMIGDRCPPSEIVERANHILGKKS